MKIKIYIISCLLSFSGLTFGQALLDAPGQVDPNDYLGITCFDFMGEIDFTSAFKFKGEVVNGVSTALKKDYTYGFSIPLIADLNRDGKPEVIVGRSTISSLQGYYNGIKILSGQDGKELATLAFHPEDDSKWYGHLNAHGAPSILAVADVDDDGFVEVIVAFPAHYGSGTYKAKVASYRIKPSGTSYTWELVWVTTDKYNAGIVTEWHYEKPIPQILDMDGDGTPEVVVYNKIYNAVTGALLLELETLGSTAYIGDDVNANTDRGIGFAYTYDMDLDGKYDVVAGGKIYYDINLTAKTYKTMAMTGVPDGRTGVADINGDGIADVVSIVRSGADLRIIAWNPNFYVVDPSDDTKIIPNPSSTPTPSILADYTFSFPSGGAGYNSYLYIGDIDGREQTVAGKTIRVPEIAILGGKPAATNFAKILKHPNVAASLPNSLGGTATGAILGFSWDAAATTENQRLKLSFVLEHQDRSQNTGFTMFDFDNDGLQEICYRDEQNLRIIKAAWPHITSTETNTAVIKFSVPCFSFTGYEYPVIADIDNDSSSDMVVIGRTTGGTDAPYGYAYAVGSNGDKFSPALSVWNQFMYDPFKINENLTVPSGPAPNRLSSDYNYTLIIRDENGVITKRIKNYNPHNGTLRQLPKYMVTEENAEQLFEPIVFLTHAYLLNENDPDVNKRPKIVTISNKAYIQVYVGNGVGAQTGISSNTPITIYNDKIGGATFLKKVTLKECGLVASAIGAGEVAMLNIPIADEFGSYIFRLGDNSDFSTPSNVGWHFGTNLPGINNQSIFTGTSTRAFRDCDWSDQTARASKFMLADDALTLQEYGTITTNILNNDILPLDFTATFNDAIITVPPTSGTLTFSGSNLTGNIVYTHTGAAPLVDGIDKFTYQLSYKGADNQTKVLTADVYIFILQSNVGGFAACPNVSYTATLKDSPTGVEYNWYDVDGTTEVGTNPQQSIVIPNITTAKKYKIKPVVPAANGNYGGVSFPQGDLTIGVIPSSSNGLQWTGKISSDWYNPANWIDDSDAEATYAPTSCVFVTIPKVATNYPSLDKKSAAYRLYLRDRAMINNVHKLKVEAGLDWRLKLKNSEQNRWLFFSAPMRKTYSGDFMERGGNNQTIINATYMSHFEAKNPDNPVSIAESSTFSRPFAHIESELPLGLGFMLYIDKNYSENNQFIFPSPMTRYGYTMNSVVDMNVRYISSDILSRIDQGVDVSKGRFIFESASDYNATTGAFTIPYSGTYILVVNPFPAQLNVKKFLEANSAVLAQEYKVWSGVADDFIGLTNGNEGQTWKIKDNATLTPIGSTDVYVAPFQSFFVKVLGSTTVNLKYEPETMTKAQAVDFSY